MRARIGTQVISAAGLMLISSAAASAAQISAGLIALEGAPLPGSGGRVVNAINTPSINGLGQVGFSGNLVNAGTTSTTGFVYVNNQIALANDSVVSPVLTGAESQVGISNAGGFVYSPSVDGEDSVYTNLGTLLRGTSAAPGFPGFFSSFNSRPLMSDDGNAFWVGGLSTTAGGSTTQRTLYKGTLSSGSYTIAPLISGGDTVGASTLTAAGISFNFNVSGNGNHVTNAGTFSGSTATDAAVLLNGSVIAREGDAIGASTWQNFRHSSVNNGGNWVIYGDDASTVDDIIVYNGALQLRQGDTVAGLTLGATVDGVALNNNGQILHLWDLPGTQPNEALFVGSPGSLLASQLLLRTGDTLDTSGDGIDDYTVTNFLGSATISRPLVFADDGSVYLDLELTPIGGSATVDAIVKIVVPEPATAGLLALAGALGLRRRR